jgi:hypothetical protein
MVAAPGRNGIAASSVFTGRSEILQDEMHSAEWATASMCPKARNSRGRSNVAAGFPVGPPPVSPALTNRAAAARILMIPTNTKWTYEGASPTPTEMADADHGKRLPR